MTKVNLTAAQKRVLSALNEHVGQFRSGYGKTAAALARLGLAKHKFISGMGIISKFAITPAGRALLASSGRTGE